MLGNPSARSEVAEAVGEDTCVLDVTSQSPVEGAGIRSGPHTDHVTQAKSTRVALEPRLVARATSDGLEMGHEGVVHVFGDHEWGSSGANLQFWVLYEVDFGGVRGLGESQHGSS